MLLFVALKLTGHIDWSWWWVVSPFWVTVGVYAALLVAGKVWAARIWRDTLGPGGPKRGG